MSKDVPLVSEVLGERAQIVAAVAMGAYAFLGGLFLYQVLCPVFGVGG